MPTRRVLPPAAAAHPEVPPTPSVSGSDTGLPAPTAACSTSPAEIRAGFRGKNAGRPSPHFSIPQWFKNQWMSFRSSRQTSRPESNRRLGLPCISGRAGITAGVQT
jgi:hypothetical protein